MLDDILKKLSKEEKVYLEKLIDTDELTGAYNRRKFNRDIRKETKRADNSNYDFTLLMIDIDYFKKYNDDKGHQEGDRILKEVSKTLQRYTKEFDTVYKYGGEEFSVILPNTTTEQGYNVAERLREAVNKQTGVTISIGLSNYKGTAKDDYELISKADIGLYQAKEQGRNRTIIYKGV